MVYGLHVPAPGRMEAKRHPARSHERHARILSKQFGRASTTFDLQSSARRDGGGDSRTGWSPKSGTRPVPFDFNRKVKEYAMSSARY